MPTGTQLPRVSGESKIFLSTYTLFTNLWANTWVLIDTGLPRSANCSRIWQVRERRGAGQRRWG